MREMEEWGVIECLSTTTRHQAPKLRQQVSPFAASIPVFTQPG